MTSDNESTQDVEATSPSESPKAASDQPDAEEKPIVTDAEPGGEEQPDADAAVSQAPVQVVDGDNDDDDEVLVVEEEPDEPKVDPVVAERDKLKDQLIRMAADFENYRRRSRRENAEAKIRGRDDALVELLPVFDNLERAVSAAEGAQKVESLVEGVRMVLKLFLDTSERMGLVRMNAVGARFDPALHEAIQQQETDEHEPGTVITEVMPGYQFGQRLLRAAMVIVARKPKAKAASEPPKADTEPPKAEAKSEAPPSDEEPAKSEDDDPATNGAPEANSKPPTADSKAPDEASPEAQEPTEEDTPEDTE